jgi:hypothetical protein
MNPSRLPFLFPAMQPHAAATGGRRYFSLSFLGTNGAIIPCLGMLMLFILGMHIMCYYFGHTISDVQMESNCLDNWCIFWVYLFCFVLFCFTDMSSQHKRTKIEIVAAKARRNRPL